MKETSVIAVKACFLFLVPSKVTNVTKEGLGVVAGGKIHQVISWSRPSNHTSELNYIIKYNLASQPSVMTTNFTSESVNLTLPTPRQPVMYYVSVAAVSDAGQGQFSNNIVLAYDGKNQCLSTNFIVHTKQYTNNIYNYAENTKKDKLTQTFVVYIFTQIILSTNYPP